jgi:hypothetical protein
MRYIKLFENFNDDKVSYTVNRVGNVYRIFALTPRMKSEGGDYEDCESLFGKGSMWKDYSTYADAKSTIDNLVRGFEEEEELLKNLGDDEEDFMDDDSE